MSFFLDFLLVLVLAGVVFLYAKRSVFSAATGVLVMGVAATASLLLTGVVAPVLSQIAITPLVERVAANELADMFSAPHRSTGRRTVEDLPLDQLVEEEPEAYRQLLAAYQVDAATVREAYAKEPSPVTVLTALTEDRAQAFSRALAFVVMTVILALLLRLFFHRVEDNLPPAGRYHGIRRAVPALLGIPAGLVILWMIVAVAQWLSPVLQGQIMLLSEQTLQAADGFSLLRRTDPFLLAAFSLFSAPQG